MNKLKQFYYNHIDAMHKVIFWTAIAAKIAIVIAIVYTDSVG